MSRLSDSLLEVTYSLIPVFGQDDFDDVFELTAGEFSVGDQYKVRNELIRLCEPCEKVIDLRGEVDEQCKKFLHKGRVHYLDDIARETFEEGLELYGQYTLGVWEEVTNTGNNFRVMQARAEQERLNAQKYEKQRKAEKLQNILATKLHYTPDNYPAHVIHFGDYFNRDEERMNYAVTAHLTFADERRCEGVTKDLSVNGLFLRIPLSEQVELGQKVKVVLTEQLPRYEEIQAAGGIEYEVKRIECIDKVFWLGLNRTFSEDKDLFTEYARTLIAGHKFVYKVNLDNAIDAVLKMGHEQVFFARSMTMAVFVENRQGQKRLPYALVSGPNEACLKYFSDDGGKQYLPSIFNATVLNRLLGGQIEQCLLYCFTHRVEGQLLYFAAFSWQLAPEPDVERLFIGFGSKLDSWRVYKIKPVAVEHDDAAVIFTLPKRHESPTDDSEQNPTTPVYDVGPLTHALMFTEISDAISSSAYVARGFDNEIMAKITRFQINHNSGAIELKWVKYGLEELRNEPRFAYKTKAVVSFDNGMRLDCTSVDFSARGVQISLPKPMNVNRLDTVLVAFPLLQKITRQLVLDKLQYKVVGTVNDQKTLYLQAIETEEVVHHGVKFFKDLIKRNQHKLTLVSESTEQMKLTKTLKNLVQKRLSSIPFYINRVSGQLRLTKLVSAIEPHPVLSRLQSDEFMGKVNIAALMENTAFEGFVSNFAKGVSDPSEYKTLILFISVSDEQLKVMTDFELYDAKRQRNFAEQALNNGQLYCFKVFLFGVARVQLRKIAQELEYIHHYAQHKSKYIALSLTRIVSVGEMVDITEFVLDYLQI